MQHTTLSRLLHKCRKINEHGRVQRSEEGHFSNSDITGEKRYITMTSGERDCIWTRLYIYLFVCQRLFLGSYWSKF